MNKKTDLFTQEESRVIEKITMLRAIGNQREADRLLRLLVDGHFSPRGKRADAKIARLRKQGNRKEADRLARIRKNDLAARRKGEQATVETAEQQRVWQETLEKAIEKGTLA